MIIATIGASNANSYVDVAYANAYFLNRVGSAIWVGADKEIALIQAAVLLDKMFDWIGEKYTLEQSMRWPRSYAYDTDDYLISYTAIPEAVKYAQCELAYSILSTGGYSGESRGIDRLKIGSIVVDFDGAATAVPIPTIVIELLRGLGVYHGSGKSGTINVPLVRV